MLEIFVSCCMTHEETLFWTLKPLKEESTQWSTSQIPKNKLYKKQLVYLIMIIIHNIYKCGWLKYSTLKKVQHEQTKTKKVWWHSNPHCSNQYKLHKIKINKIPLCQISHKINFSTNQNVKWVLISPLWQCFCLNKTEKNKSLLVLFFFLLKF